MHKVLLIWEEIPEKTKLYFFTKLTNEEYDKILLCQNHFINMENEGETDEEAAALDWLNKWLEDKNDCLLDNKSPFMPACLVTVVLSGFLL